MTPAKMIKLEMVIVLFQVFFGIGNTVGSDDVGATVSLLTGTRVCIH